MTTAHRPTWAPAVGGSGKQEGGLGSLSRQYSVRDQAAHTKLKFRQPGQGTVAENELTVDDLRADLQKREHEARTKRKAEDSSGAVALAMEASEKADKRLKAIEALDADLDADDVHEGDSDSESDSDDDDEAELLRELQRIKSERAKETAEREAVKNAEEEQIRNESYLRGNPLLTGAASASSDHAVDRRWDDDVVFKNCARKKDEDKGFVNDTLRSDFHRRFMSKYVR